MVIGGRRHRLLLLSIGQLISHVVLVRRLANDRQAELRLRLRARIGKMRNACGSKRPGEREDNANEKAQVTLFAGRAHV